MSLERIKRLLHPLEGNDYLETGQSEKKKQKKRMFKRKRREERKKREERKREKEKETACLQRSQNWFVVGLLINPDVSKQSRNILSQGWGKLF